MSAEEFLKELKLVRRPPQEYMDRGMRAGATVRDGYEPKLRVLQPEVITEDPFIHLVTHYDLSDTYIGAIWFDLDDSQLIEDEINYHVAKCDGNFMCISKKSGEVLVYSYEDLDFKKPMFRCAQDGAFFLSALVDAAKFLEKSLVDPGLAENVDVVDTVAEHCAGLAGGQVYFDFYRALLMNEIPDGDWEGA